MGMNSLPPSVLDDDGEKTAVECVQNFEVSMYNTPDTVTAGFDTELRNVQVKGESKRISKMMQNGYLSAGRFMTAVARYR